MTVFNLCVVNNCRRTCGLFFHRLLCNSSGPQKNVICRSKKVTGSTYYAIHSVVVFWFPRTVAFELFGCSSVRSSDVPCLRSCIRLRLSRKAHLRRHLSFGLWMIWVRISSSTAIIYGLYAMGCIQLHVTLVWCSKY